MTDIDTASIRELVQHLGGNDELVLSLCDAVDRLRAENAQLIRRLGDQERFNIESRRSLCEQSDRYKARVAELEAKNENMRGELRIMYAGAIENDAERDALRAVVDRIRSWAEGNYGGVKRPIDVWPGLRAALDAVPVRAPMPEPRKTACCNAQPQCAECSPLWRDTTEGEG